MSFPRSAFSLSLEFDIAILLRRLGFKPDDPRQGSFGPVELSQPQGAQERSRRRNAAPFVLPFVRTSENDRKRRARGRPPRHTVARTLGASASSAQASLMTHSAWFFNAEEVR